MTDGAVGNEIREEDDQNLTGETTNHISKTTNVDTENAVDTQNHQNNNAYRNNRSTRSGSNGHMRPTNSANNNGTTNRNLQQQQQQQQCQQHKPRPKPNDNMRNIGTWSNEQIGKNGTKKQAAECPTNIEDWENNEEEWDGDLSKTQIYTATNTQKFKQDSSADQNESTK